MGSAARHRERAEEPPPDASAVIAELGRIGDETDAIIGRMNRIDGGPQLIVEAISLAAHWAEAREQLEALAARLPSLAEVHRMGVEDGRRQAEREAAEREAAERARPVRHRHRKPHLTMVTGAAAAAVVAASAGTVYVAHDSASVHPWAASRPASARFHAGPADSAVPVPSPSAKPSVAVKAAAPAPSVTASPTPSSPPPAPAPPAPAPSVSPPPPAPAQAPSPSLLVSVRDLDLTGTSGTFTITAQDGPVDWWVSTDIPGASVDVRQGVLSPGQDPVTITVTVPPGGEAGYVYVKWDGGGIASVWVTPSAGAPAVALP